MIRTPISPGEIPGMDSYNLARPRCEWCCLPGRGEKFLSLSWHSRRHESQPNLSVEPDGHRHCPYIVKLLTKSIPKHFQPNPGHPKYSSPDCNCRPAARFPHPIQPWRRGHLATYFPTDTDCLCHRCARRIPILLRSEERRVGK